MEAVDLLLEAVEHLLGRELPDFEDLQGGRKLDVDVELAKHLIVDALVQLPGVEVK